MHTRAYLPALAVLCLAALAPAARGQDEQALRKLTAECQRAVTDARLDEALVVRVRDGGGGALLADVVVGDKTDLKKVAEAVEQALGKAKATGKLGEVRRLDWDASAPRLQQALAGSGDEVLERTRVDRAYLEYSDQHQPQLYLDVVSFHPSQQAEGGKGAGVLLDRLGPVVGRVTPALQSYHGSRIRLTSRPAADPRATFQNLLAEKLGRHNLIVTGARYDGAGAVQLEGFVDRTDARQTLDAAAAALRAHKADDEAARATLAGSWSLTGLRPVAWTLSADRLQAAAAAGGPLMQQTRIERVSFRYRNGQLHLVPEGYCLDPDARDKGTLLDRLQQWWEGQRGDDPLRRAVVAVDPEKVRAVSQPAALFQSAVAAVRELDGVRFRVSDRAVFDEQGRLSLSGLWDDPRQAAALEKVIAQVLRDKDSPLRDCRLAFGGMTAAGTQRLRDDLRAWVAKKTDLEEVWIDRVYFDADGRLQVHVLTTQGQSAAVARVRERLTSVLQYHPDSKQIGPLAAPAEPVPPEDSELVFAGDEKQQPSLAVELRKRFHGDSPETAGILIRRCFFDVDGTYVVSGLVDREPQRAAVTTTLQELAEEDAWRPLLAKGRRVELEVLPLRPMLDAAGAVLAAYPEFDGLRVAAGYHDAGRKLVLAGYQVKGLGDKAAAEALLKRLLDADPVWSRRSGAGVTLKTEAIERNEALAELAVHRVADVIRKSLPDGASACDLPDPPLLLPPYRRGGKDQFAPLPKEVAETTLAYLNTALMHSPDDAAAWFLRAMCHLSRGDRVLAARDLRRLATLEGDRPYARADRLQKLEHVQGSLRMVAADFGDHVAIEAGRGRPALTLAEVRGASSQPVAALTGPLLAARAGAVAR